MNAALALQTAMRTALLGDAGLVAALGGARVFDNVPQGTPMPYLTVGEIETSDWSTQTDRGAEHRVTLRAWSGHRGRREAHGVITEAQRVLDGASLSLDGHRLVSLSVTFWTVVRTLEGEAYEGVLRLRAVTEEGE